MICHYTNDWHGYAHCGVFPQWCTTSWSAVTCPGCLDKRAAEDQEWLCMGILAEHIPPEPDTAGSASDALYGQLDLGEASAEELDIWWDQVKHIPFGE